MLKINKTRQTTAQFFAVEGELEKLVKTTTINTDNNAVSTVYEMLHDAKRGDVFIWGRLMNGMVQV